MRKAGWTAEDARYRAFDAAIRPRTGTSGVFTKQFQVTIIRFPSHLPIRLDKIRKAFQLVTGPLVRDPRILGRNVYLLSVENAQLTIVYLTL